MGDWDGRGRGRLVRGGCHERVVLHVRTNLFTVENGRKMPHKFNPPNNNNKLLFLFANLVGVSKLRGRAVVMEP